MEKMMQEIPSLSIVTRTETIGLIFGKSRNENFISDWLAYLFRINQNVIKALCLSVSSNELAVTNLANLNDYEFEIEREYTFSDGRRIDFLLSNEDNIIAIEHKVDSGEQANQLRDYSESLKGINFQDKAIYKILLKPSSNTIETTHDFMEVTYEEFINELKKISTDFIGDLRGSFLLLDFIKHIEENFIVENQKKFEFNDWTKFINKYQNEINKINKSMESEIKNINTYLKQRILLIVDNNSDWILGENKSTKYIQLFKTNWNIDNEMPYIHFEILFDTEKNLPTSCCIRLDIEGGNEEKRSAISQLISDKLSICDKSGKNEKIFMLKKGFNINYSDSETFYQSIDKLMSIFKEYIEELTPILDKAIEQARGK